MIHLKEMFTSIFTENITRNGSDNLLKWLYSTDFFVAPASTKFHASYEGGLCEHSLNVFKIFKNRFLDNSINLETMAIISLLHDICKCNFYYKTFKNVKNIETNIWEKKSVYVINDELPMGHGEKSVFLIERFMKLNEVEAMAIRWHMGSFDDSARGNQYCGLSKAFEKFPLCVKLHISDLESTFLYENSIKKNNI